MKPRPGLRHDYFYNNMVPHYVVMCDVEDHGSTWEAFTDVMGVKLEYSARELMKWLGY